MSGAARGSRTRPLARLTGLLLALLPATALGQMTKSTEDEIVARIDRITKGMRCPCDCTMALDVCACDDHPGEPWKSAKFIKEKMRDWISAGKSDEEIKSLLVQNAGEMLLQSPPFQGFNLVLYFGIPVLAFGGLGLVFVMARRLSRPSASAPGTAAPASDEPKDPLVERHRARIEDEIRKFRP